MLKVVQSHGTESSMDDPQHDQHETQDEEEGEAEIEVQGKRNVGGRPKKTRNTAKNSIARGSG